MKATTPSHSTHDEVPDSSAQADEMARWQWLGVIGAGLIAAAITAIAMPAAAQDAAMTAPAAPTAMHGHPR